MRQLIADTGAGTAQAGFELLLHENDCQVCGGIPSYPVTLGGAYTGSFPVYVVRIQIPALGFDHHFRAAAVPSSRVRRDRLLPLSQSLRLRELR